MSFRQAGASQHGYLAMRDRPGDDGGGHHSYRRPPVPRCYRCSYKQPRDEPAKVVHHFHYSSKMTRELAMNSSGELFCPSCMKVHKDHLPNDRIKVCLTSSILHQYWAPPRSENLALQYGGDKLHIDHIGIPGATIDILTKAFRVDYEEERRGMDVVIVAYYNDFLKGRSARSILRSYDWLLHVLKSQARHYHPDHPNTLAIATLPYPPQLCWYHDDGPYPTPHYQNHLEEMTWLNDQIILLNAENGIPNAPKFHTYGERITNKRSKDRYGQVTMRHVRKHRWEHWREEDPSDMLHLSNQSRMAMGRSVGKYFLHNTSKE